MRIVSLLQPCLPNYKSIHGSCQLPTWALKPRTLQCSSATRYILSAAECWLPLPPPATTHIKIGFDLAPLNFIWHWPLTHSHINTAHPAVLQSVSFPTPHQRQATHCTLQAKPLLHHLLCLGSQFVGPTNKTPFHEPGSRGGVSYPLPKSGMQGTPQWAACYVLMV